MERGKGTDICQKPDSKRRELTFGVTVQREMKRRGGRQKRLSWHPDLAFCKLCAERKFFSSSKPDFFIGRMELMLPALQHCRLEVGKASGYPLRPPGEG